MTAAEAVDAEAGAVRITGGFGTGKTTTLTARARRLRDRGRRVVMFRRPSDLVGYSSELLRRHGRPYVVIDDAAQREVVRRLLAASVDEWGDLAGEVAHPSFAPEVARTLLRYQCSFLGAEELFVHAEAAGELSRWEALDRFTIRYRDELTTAGHVDAAGAVVAASMLLRTPEVLAHERELVDDVLVDDFQLADFAVNRLLTQLVGRDGSLTVAGNADAAIGSERGWSPRFLDRFCRRFDAVSYDLGPRSFRATVAPVVRVLDAHEDREPLFDSLVTGHSEGRRIGHDDVVDAIGQEWPIVVVDDASADVWPSPRPKHLWFDPHLFGGPDVPSDDQRDAAWIAEERRRFAIACSRATKQTFVVGMHPVTPFVSDLAV